MVDRHAATFTEQVRKAADKVGNNAPKIADRLLKRELPNAVAGAERDGVSKMLRTGIITAVKNVLKHGAGDDDQIDFSDIDPQFAAIVGRLKSKTYFVKSADEYVEVANLIADPALLNDARRFMRSKGEECLAEADVLDELYSAVRGKGR